MGPEFTLLRFDPALDVAGFDAAWRGDRTPADPLALIVQVRGAAN